MIRIEEFWRLPVPDQKEFPTIFYQLKDFLAPFAGTAKVSADLPDVYMLDTPFSERYGREISVGGVKIGKNYVSYYLMPVYIYPDLLKDISPELKRRMQGKSCFNFTHADDNLFAELKELTERSLRRYREEGLLPNS
jgi:hypothetical protein